MACGMFGSVGMDALWFYRKDVPVGGSMERTGI